MDVFLGGARPSKRVSPALKNAIEKASTLTSTAKNNEALSLRFFDYLRRSSTQTESLVSRSLEEDLRLASDWWETLPGKEELARRLEIGHLLGREFEGASAEDFLCFLEVASTSTSKATPNKREWGALVRRSRITAFVVASCIVLGCLLTILGSVGIGMCNWAGSSREGDGLRMVDMIVGSVASVLFFGSCLGLYVTTIRAWTVVDAVAAIALGAGHPLTDSPNREELIGRRKIRMELHRGDGSLFWVFCSLCIVFLIAAVFQNWSGQSPMCSIPISVLYTLSTPILLAGTAACTLVVYRAPRAFSLAIHALHQRLHNATTESDIGQIVGDFVRLNEAIDEAGAAFHIPVTATAVGGLLIAFVMAVSATVDNTSRNAIFLWIGVFPALLIVAAALLPASRVNIDRVQFLLTAITKPSPQTAPFLSHLNALLQAVQYGDGGFRAAFNTITPNFIYASLTTLYSILLVILPRVLQLF